MLSAFDQKLLCDCTLAGQEKKCLVLFDPTKDQMSTYRYERRVITHIFSRFTQLHAQIGCASQSQILRLIRRIRILFIGAN